MAVVVIRIVETSALVWRLTIVDAVEADATAQLNPAFMFLT